MPGSERTRAPRLRVLANGVVVPGAVSAEVLSNSHYGADRFRVRLALPMPGAAPAWAATSHLMMAVEIGLDGGYAGLIVGLADQVSIDPVASTVEIEGRDRTAALIEARTHESFTNRTASEIATELAGRHGLQADVQATTTPAGRYWQLEHDRVTLDQFSRATTEWDLLAGLAAREGFEVWVSGDTLHFRAASERVGPHAVLRARATVDGAANVIGLRLQRALTLARDIEVSVKSWNSRSAQSFTQIARATRQPGIGARAGNMQRYSFVVPDLQPEAALQLAQRKLAELSRHERVIVAEMPGELHMDARMMCRLEGTGTAFDQEYYIDEICRRIDQAEGFRQTVRARNISADARVT